MSDGRARQGFASLSPEKRKEISSKGGRAAQDRGVAHRWTTEEARVAGALGGSKRHENARKRKGGSRG